MVAVRHKAQDYKMDLFNHESVIMVDGIPYIAIDAAAEYTAQHLNAVDEALNSY